MIKSIKSTNRVQTLTHIKIISQKKLMLGAFCIFYVVVMQLNAANITAIPTLRS
jgi:hypothetical protein